MGSAPTKGAANRGLEDTSIKLGCVQPGEGPAIFGDALRKLSDSATYLYVNDKRYWYSTQATVTRLAQDRAAQQSLDVVWEELRQRLRKDKERGDFAGVHMVPAASGDVPDDQEARLVVLGPEYPHSGKDASSPARVAVQDILEHRGSAPRLARNMLVFVAPDRTRLVELEDGIRQYLAWKSILDERKTLNLDEFQGNLATSKTAEADRTVESRTLETFVWLLTPEEPQATSEGTGTRPVAEWPDTRLQGQERPAIKASRKLKSDELLVTTYAASRLRLELDSRNLWRDRDHISLKQLWDYIASYLYMPRFKNRDVLIQAVKDGVAQMSWDTFAYAEGYDDIRGRYRGLVMSSAGAPVTIDGQSVLVKPEVASRQIEAERPQPLPQPTGPVAVPEDGSAVGGDAQPGANNVGDAKAPYVPKLRVLRRFHGSVNLDPLRTSRDVGNIAQEIIQHLTAMSGARVEITLEIEADLPDGASDDVVRTVSENCRTLKFTSQGFEEQ